MDADMQIRLCRKKKKIPRDLKEDIIQVQQTRWISADCTFASVSDVVRESSKAIKHLRQRNRKMLHRIECNGSRYVKGGRDKEAVWSSALLKRR